MCVCVHVHMCVQFYAILAHVSIHVTTNLVETQNCSTAQEGCCCFLLYEHPLLPRSVLHQPCICPPFPEFCHLKNVLEMELYNIATIQDWLFPLSRMIFSSIWIVAHTKSSFIFLRLNTIIPLSRHTTRLCLDVCPPKDVWAFSTVLSLKKNSCHTFVYKFLWEHNFSSRLNANRHNCWGA